MLAQKITVNDTHLDAHEARAIQILEAIFGERYLQNFAIRLWTGRLLPPAGEQRFELVISAPYSLRAAFMPPLDLHPAEAYVNGLIDIIGDLEFAADTMIRAGGALSSRRSMQIVWMLMRLPKPPQHMQSMTETPAAKLQGGVHSIERDTKAIQLHYDKPPQMYQAFLDKNLVYSCAYFRTPELNLEQAQLAKFDHIFRKLRLKAGERMLDIGCGWGALLIHAAKHYGVTAVGVTLSEEQAAIAQCRVQEAGLQDRVCIELRDYRTLPLDEPFDKITSVGMIEHIGKGSFTEYFAKAYALLKDGGMFLNHGITDETRGHQVARKGDFIDTYIFPDAELVSISDTLVEAERAGFEVRDVENLREHYAKTLRIWLANLERAEDQLVRDGVKENVVRAWRLYLAGSAQGFTTRRMGLMQSLLAKPMPDGTLEIPATRADLYQT